MPFFEIILAMLYRPAAMTGPSTRLLPSTFSYRRPYKPGNGKPAGRNDNSKDGQTRNAKGITVALSQDDGHPATDTTGFTARAPLMTS
jgi:hypothetical protein